MAARGWGEEKFIPRGWLTFMNKERGGGRGVKIFLPSPTPNIHSNCKSKMAGRTTDHELFSVSSH